MKVAKDVGDYWITVPEKRSKEDLLEVDEFLEEQGNDFGNGVFSQNKL